jgi:general secretion pathway protein H
VRNIGSYPQLSDPHFRIQQGGFTLIEIMVVVIIIGVIVSFASLSFNQQTDQRLASEAKRMHHLLNLASDEAIMQAKEYAIQFSEHGYVFLGLGKDNKFVPLASDNLFRKRELEDDMRIKLELEGESVTFDSEKEPASIFIMSSGEITPPFVVTLSNIDETQGEYKIKGSYSGEILLKTPGENKDGADAWDF